MFKWLSALRGFGAPRSGRWRSVRAEHLKSNPACAACGRKKDLEVHHLLPVHVRPDLELDPGNLITLCADPCHLVHGHLMSWTRHNQDCVEDCRRYRAKLERVDP